MHRFYAPGLDPSLPSVDLPAEETRHLAQVLRLDRGAPVRVFDGRGGEYRGRVARVADGTATVDLDEPVPGAREPIVDIILAVAVLKGAKMDQVVRDAAMLGATGIRPVVSTRAETSASRLRASGRAERWRRIAIASAKQCGRAVVPAVHDPVALEVLLDDAAVVGTRRPLALVEPGAAEDVTRLPSATGPKPAGGVLVLVGPEGGWTAAEVARVRVPPWQAVSLGGLTLRAETVPLAVLAALRCLWDDL